MAFPAELKIEGAVLKVLTCEYGFNQQVDVSGRPVPRVSCGTIKIDLVGTEDETNISWASNHRKKIEGTITFYKQDEQTKLREIKFEDAFCIRYKETVLLLKNSKENTYRHSIEISAGKLTIGEAKYNSYWPE
jgi:hypothetical protein